MARKRNREPLMVSVWCELGKGKIVEAYIPDKQEFVEGETQSNGHITINPAHAVCDVCIHEILHRLRPGWSEAYVRRTTTYLRRRMTDEETMQFYTEFQNRVKKRRKRGSVGIVG
jgi:hypothetical protein